MHFVWIFDEFGVNRRQSTYVQARLHRFSPKQHSRRKAEFFKSHRTC